MAGRSGRTSFQVLLAVRFLLLANGLVLAAIAALYGVFAERPAGLVVAGLLGCGSAACFGALPLTNPYRRERSTLPKP